jgi:hypothetical protein
MSKRSPVYQAFGGREDCCRRADTHSVLVSYCFDVGYRRGVVIALGALAASVAFASGLPGVPNANAQLEPQTVSGTAEWRNGKGNCNSGTNVQNFPNGTGSPYTTVDMPATITVNGRHVSVAWRDPGANHGPWFGPVDGDIAEDNSFELKGHNEYDPSWTWSGKLNGLEMAGPFTRQAIFSSAQPPCTATWDVTLRLTKALPFAETDTAGGGAKLCLTKVGEGALEPTQGVWQHDPGKFRDRPGARLRQVNPTTWDAELPMVSDRPTLVFGSPAHDTIRIVGITTGTTKAKTTLHLTATGAGATLDTRLELGSASQHLSFFGPCGARRRFVAVVSVPKGLPEKESFLFGDTGEYTISGQLESGGSKVEPPIRVTGKVVKTNPPRTLIVPVSLGSAPADGTPDVATSNLVQHARDIARESQQFIPDFFPVASYEVHSDDDVYYAGVALKAHKSTGAKDDNINFLATSGEQEVKQRGLLDRYDRIVLLVSKKDYRRIDPGSEGSDGYTAAQKMIVVPDHIGTKAGSGVASAATVALQIAHETAHTLPYLWSSAQMKTQCSLDYHNVDGANVAYGYRITLDGAENRKLIDGRASLMSEIFANTERDWIDQCTYANALAQLQNKP